MRECRQSAFGAVPVTVKRDCHPQRTCASRWRVIRQLMIESLLLSLLGGVAGILLDFWLVGLIARLVPTNIPRLDEVNTDGRVLVFTLGISVITGLIFGLAPALQTSKLGYRQSIRESIGGSTGNSVRSVGRNVLIVSEIALSLVLLIGAGLLIRSFARLLDVKPGFNAANVLTMKLSLADSKYPYVNHQIAFYQHVIDRVAALPGMQSVSVASSPPFGGINEWGAFVVEGHLPASLDQVPIADRHRVSADYFHTVGIPLVKGRFFSREDIENRLNNVVISESLAKQFFSTEDPIGKRLMQGNPAAPGDWLTIVGVVGDIRQTSLESDTRPTIYMPYPMRWSDSMTMLVRSTSDPKNQASAIRDAIWQIDKDEPVADVRPLEDYLSDSTRLRRFNLTLLGAFAVIALMLASVGIYGVMSYSVTQRTQEFGIRMALGAQRSDVLKMVMSKTIILAAIGIAIGVGLALPLTRLMASLLYQVSATDPLTFGVISLLLIGVAVLAGYVPARRATRVDPMIALRYQ